MDAHRFVQESPNSDVSWRARLVAARWLWIPLLAFGITRLSIALLAYIAAPLIADSTTPPPYHLRPPYNTLLDVFGSRWDTGFYLSIAEEGYKYEGVPLPSVAFFPLLPLVMRAAKYVVGDVLLGGLIVTNMALVGAMMLLYRFVENEWGTSVSIRTVWYTLIFPASFFGSAIYSESLFLLGAIGTLLAARRRHWGMAAVLGMLTSLTRFVGLIMAPTLAIEWWLQRRNPAVERGPPLKAFFAPAAVFLGTGAYMLYLHFAFGDALAFAHAASAWDREPRSPFVTFAALFRRPVEGWGAAIAAGHIPLDNWIDLLSVLLFLSLGLILLQKRHLSEGTFVVLGALVSFSSGLLISQRRYMWVLFPAFILLARWGQHQWFDRTITVVSLLGLGLFTAMFANGYWVG